MPKFRLLSTNTAATFVCTNRDYQNYISSCDLRRKLDNPHTEIQRRGFWKKVEVDCIMLTCLKCGAADWKVRAEDGKKVCEEMGGRAL